MCAAYVWNVASPVSGMFGGVAEVRGWNGKSLSYCTR